MDKMYQVFVSSPLKDLREERGKVTDAILRAGCYPSGMEQFPASDNTQIDFVSKLIERCDYFVLVLAGCYGSTNDDGKGFTELEFEIAESKAVPILAFVHEKPQSAEPSDVRDPTTWAKLMSFRNRIQKRGKINATYADKGDLALKVHHSLTNAIKEGRRAGWSRDVRFGLQEGAKPENVGLNLSRSANIYWAASDVMETIHRLLSGQPPGIVLQALRQFVHHTEQIEADKIRGIRTELAEIYQKIESSLTQAVRDECVLKLHKIMGIIGATIETAQADFKPGPGLEWRFPPGS